MVELSLSKHCLPNHLSTTRFHSFIDGNIPSVCDYQFIGEFFTDVFTDGIRPSAFLSSETQKNHLLMVLQMKFGAKKKVSRLKYTNRFYSVGDIVIDRRLRTVGKFVGECLKYRPNISVCKFDATILFNSFTHI